MRKIILAALALAVTAGAAHADDCASLTSQLSQATAEGKRQLREVNALVEGSTAVIAKRNAVQVEMLRNDLNWRISETIKQVSLGAQLLTEMEAQPGRCGLERGAGAEATKKAMSLIGKLNDLAIN